MQCLCVEKTQRAAIASSFPLHTWSSGCLRIHSVENFDSFVSKGRCYVSKGHHAVHVMRIWTGKGDCAQLPESSHLKDSKGSYQTPLNLKNCAGTFTCDSARCQNRLSPTNGSKTRSRPLLGQPFRAILDLHQVYMAHGTVRNSAMKALTDITNPNFLLFRTRPCTGTSHSA